MYSHQCRHLSYYIPDHRLLDGSLFYYNLLLLCTTSWCADYEFLNHLLFRLYKYSQISTKQSFVYSLKVINGVGVDDALRSDSLLYFDIHMIKLGGTYCKFRVPKPPKLGLRTRPGHFQHNRSPPSPPPQPSL